MNVVQAQPVGLGPSLHPSPEPVGALGHHVEHRAALGAPTLPTQAVGDTSGEVQHHEALPRSRCGIHKAHATSGQEPLDDVRGWGLPRLPDQLLRGDSHHTTGGVAPHWEGQRSGLLVVAHTAGDAKEGKSADAFDEPRHGLPRLLLLQ